MQSPEKEIYRFFQTSNDFRFIVCIGDKGSGKSTFSKSFAQFYGWQHFDSDQLLMDRFHAHSISTLYQSLGPVAFRNQESLLILERIRNLLKTDRSDQSSKGVIFSLGGGSLGGSFFKKLTPKEVKIELQHRKLSALLQSKKICTVYLRRSFIGILKQNSYLSSLSLPLRLTLHAQRHYRYQQCADNDIEVGLFH